MNGYEMMQKGQLVDWLSCGTFKDGVRFVPEWVAKPDSCSHNGMRYTDTCMDTRSNRLVDRYSVPGRLSKVSTVSESASRCSFLMGSNQVRLCHLELDRIRFPTNPMGPSNHGMCIELTAMTENGPEKYSCSVGMVYDYGSHPLALMVINALNAECPGWSDGRAGQWSSLNGCLDKVLKSQDWADELLAKFKRKGLIRPFETFQNSDRVGSVMFYRAKARRIKFIPISEWNAGVDPSKWGEDGLTLDELNKRFNETRKEDEKAGVVIWRIGIKGCEPDAKGWRYNKI